MLTLFVLKSGIPTANPRDLIKTFGQDYISKVVETGNLSEINKAAKDTDWFGVFYDNEILSRSLSEAIPVFLRDYENADVFVVFKILKHNQKMVTKSPRLFKSNVKLQKNSLLPEDRSLKFESILDGFLEEA